MLQQTILTFITKGEIDLPIFTHENVHNATQKEIWDWYNSPGAFRRIMPEWEGIRPINAGALRDDEETIF